MITDPVFYLFAIPAVLLFGIAKGGFGGGLGILAVPLMTFAVSPIQAAAILLPILCLMDIFGIWAWRGQWRWRELKLLLPASMIGVVLGALLFQHMSVSLIRLVLGLIAITFTIHHWVEAYMKQNNQGQVAAPMFGVFAAAVGGFTSFIAHSGGPPVSMYLLKRNLGRAAFAATTVYLFFAINFAKLFPYAWLGQFDMSNLTTSLILAPLAPIGVYSGVWLHKRVSDELFFKIAYSLLFLVGLSLAWDGINDLLLT